MKTLDINKLHIIATEWDNNDPIDRIYVVAKSIDSKYDDPMTCVVEFDQNNVFAAHPMHQYYKFSYPVPLDVSEERVNTLYKRLQDLPFVHQMKLIELYDPDAFIKGIPLDPDDMYAFVSKKMSLPLSEDEFEQIETGFRIRWNYSTGQVASGDDFDRSVIQYLTSMESPIDRKKITMVVDLLLEFMEGIGEWQEDYPF